jgi:type II secretory pathway pseudopilin PulG
MTYSSSRGASILEVAIAMMIIALLASGIGSALYTTTLNARDRAAVNQIEGIRNAIVGETGAIATGPDFFSGYVSDIGSLPASVKDLETAGVLPNFSIDPALQVGAGWRGPYISSATAADFIDPWGNALVYSTTPGTSALTGAATVATIRSAGADGTSGTADDHAVEIYQSETFTTLIGYVKDSDAFTIPGVSVELSYPLNGTLAAITTVTDGSGLYTFGDVPRGRRTLQLTPGLLYRNGTALASGNNRNNLEFVVDNLARNATSATSLKVSWTTTPASDFKRLVVDGVEMFSGTVPSGTTLTISPAKTVSGTGVIQAPFHTDVSGLVMQVPDVRIGTAGSGGSIAVGLEDFEEAGSNNNVDVTGVNFTIEFSDGSKSVFSAARQ